MVGRVLVQAAMFALMPVWAPTRVVGREHLADLPGPLLFAANHVSHMDTPAALRALPRTWRERTAVAAAKDYFFTRRLRGFCVGLAFNAFPMSRSASVRPPLTQFGYLAERGWSILFFPEGTRSPNGNLLPFKGGIGVLAVELGVPVVPIRTRGLERVLPKGTSWPRRASVEVRFGAPLSFAPGTDYDQATEAIERAMHAL
jgi:long-chain acyl-CoA synthetase